MHRTEGKKSEKQTFNHTHNAPNPINHQTKKANKPQPQPSTAAILPHIRQPSSLLPHMRPGDFVQTQHEALRTSIGIINEINPEILLRQMQTPQTLHLARQRRSACRESAGRFIRGTDTTCTFCEIYR